MKFLVETNKKPSSAFGLERAKSKKAYTDIRGRK